MILDSVTALQRYASLHPHISKAVDFLARPDLPALAPGKHAILDKQIFAIVMKVQGKQPEEAPLEVHDAFIDIQVLLNGNERMGWKPRSACSNPAASFNAEKDIQFFTDKPDSYFDLQPGQMAIFLPGDAHAPMIAASEIHKIVLKLAL